MDATTRSHLVGLLLGTENDWPVAFESLVRAWARSPTATGPPTRSRPSGSPSSRSTCATSPATSS